MQTVYYTHSAQFNTFFQKLKDSRTVFAPVVKDHRAPVLDYYLSRALGNEPLVYNAYRGVIPLKSFFTHPLEDASAYFGPEAVFSDLASSVIFGVKSCDITAHRVQDYVFLEGVEVDAHYRLRREKTIFISSDCTGFKEVCFCLALDILPHPTCGFDLNLSPLHDGYLVEVGSASGQQLIDEFKECFTPSRPSQLVGRQEKRDTLIERLRRHLLPQNLPPKASLQRLVKEGYQADTWQHFMRTCVECGGCNFICDTCHCFLLKDAPAEGGHKKLKLWDSCLYANYASVAGGANPLKMRAQRLRFRFTKKFDFFVDNLHMPACCGCGRCIEVCPGKIDIRQVLKDLAQKVPVSA